MFLNEILKRLMTSNNKIFKLIKSEKLKLDKEEKLFSDEPEN